jgi:hypothetical protein
MVYMLTLLPEAPHSLSSVPREFFWWYFNLTFKGNRFEFGLRRVIFYFEIDIVLIF